MSARTFPIGRHIFQGMVTLAENTWSIHCIIHGPDAVFESPCQRVVSQKGNKSARIIAPDIVAEGLKSECSNFATRFSSPESLLSVFGCRILRVKAF